MKTNIKTNHVLVHTYIHHPQPHLYSIIVFNTHFQSDDTLAYNQRRIDVLYRPTSLLQYSYTKKKFHE